MVRKKEKRFAVATGYHITIEFFGGARTVTGSMHLLEVGDHRVLLDCGLFQGRHAEANECNCVFPFDPESVDAIILFHAHIDHSGNIPRIVKRRFHRLV